jgi:type 1 glutamine amidotransferase
MSFTSMKLMSPNITPLLTSNYTFQQEHFYSAAAVVERGLMHCNDGWTHPSGSSLVGWTKQYDNSRICYLQGGDDAEAWQNEHYQQLLNNAIAWASNDGRCLTSPNDRSRKHALALVLCKVATQSAAQSAFKAIP